MNMKRQSKKALKVAFVLLACMFDITIDSGVSKLTHPNFRNEWEELKTEYLSWQAELHESMKPSESGASRYNQSNPGGSYHAPQRPKDQPPHLPHEQCSEPRKPLSVPPNSQLFPQGCLLFVKNLHPQTNKTTLKKLFESALESASLPKNDGRSLDYVDWSKGMSSVSCCFFSQPGASNLLRLA